MRFEEGVLLFNFVAIRRRVIGFYEKLYRSELGLDNISESVFFMDLLKVFDEVNVEILGAFSLGELYKVV